MLIRPMIGRWEVPHIEGITSRESRRLAVLPVPGLSGDLHQDLGRDALEVELHGSLSGDQARDDFLKELRGQFLAGDPVDFVADIVNESELEQVLITAFELQESADRPDEFRYRLALREYTEPPEPPGLGDGFGLDVDGLLDLDVDLGLDLLDLPGLLGDVPDIGDLLAPVEPAVQQLKDTLAGAAQVLGPLDELLG
ncbi:hypothetical protein [Sphaerotilus microaerophilus]|uniref:Uncharacterized protein n=1 Tax=Sphaerotilus microaerophilus TaxID=2914710 RepID=A0ABM7YJY5_9BURK|nr:hypothetical protein [Sphaerotilus sp. FB-5]BDI04732.1 hypothetical protein CATMQ487_17020 [Sphaerotilus sp. FB-5]